MSKVIGYDNTDRNMAPIELKYEEKMSVMMDIMDDSPEWFVCK